jgi:hypothetical protein
LDWAAKRTWYRGSLNCVVGGNVRVAGAAAGAKVFGFRGGCHSGLVGEPSLAVSLGWTGGSAKGFVGGRDPSQA